MNENAAPAPITRRASPAPAAPEGSGQVGTLRARFVGAASSEGEKGNASNTTAPAHRRIPAPTRTGTE